MRMIVFFLPLMAAISAAAQETGTTTSQAKGGVPVWAWIIIAAAVIVLAYVLARMRGKKKGEGE